MRILCVVWDLMSPILDSGIPVDKTTEQVFRLPLHNLEERP